MPRLPSPWPPCLGSQTRNSAFGGPLRGEHSCKTNPIRGHAARNEAGGTRRDCAKRTQFLDCGLRIQKGLWPAARACRAGCTNKANWPEPIVRNEANLPGRARWGEARGTWDEGTIMQNKPNLEEPILRNKANSRRPGRRDTSAFHSSIIPPSQSDAGCTNKPNHGQACPEPRERDAHATKTPEGISTNAAVFLVAKSAGLRYIHPVGHRPSPRQEYQERNRL
jgi:hypothetical protein